MRPVFISIGLHSAVALAAWALCCPLIYLNKYYLNISNQSTLRMVSASIVDPRLSPPPLNLARRYRLKNKKPWPQPKKSEKIMESTNTPNGALVNHAHWEEFRPAPSYPEFAKRKGWEGKVLIEISSDADGKIHYTSLKESSGYAILDNAALETLRYWRIKPRSKLFVPILFRLTGKKSWGLQHANRSASQ